MPIRKPDADGNYVTQPARGAPSCTRRVDRRAMRKAFRAAFNKLRGPRRRRPAWRPCPSSMPRPREGGARLVAGGCNERGPPDDDGGGDDGGAGSDPPPPPRSGALFAGRRP